MDTPRVSTVAQMLFDRFIDVPARDFPFAKLRMEQLLLSLRVFLGDQGIPTSSQCFAISGDHPSPTGHDARSGEIEQRMQRGEIRPLPIELREEGRTPVRRTLGLVLRVEGQRGERNELVLPLALWQRAKPHMRRLLLVLS